MHRDKTNLDDRASFVIMQVGSVYKILTHLTKVFLKLKRSNTENKFDHITLSSAFLTSNGMTTPPFAQRPEWLLILSNHLLFWDEDLLMLGTLHKITGAILSQFLPFRQSKVKSRLS